MSEHFIEFSGHFRIIVGQLLHLFGIGDVRFEAQERFNRLLQSRQLAL